jgi:hypothetical protein
MLLLGMVFGRHSGDWRFLAGGMSAALLWYPLALLLDVLTGRMAASPGAGEDESRR